MIEDVQNTLLSNLSLAVESSTLSLHNKLKYSYRKFHYKIGSHGQEVVQIRRILKRGDVAIDVGAYKGGLTSWMMSSVGPAGKVIAIEPQFELANRLNAFYKRRNELSVINAALSNDFGTAKLRVPNSEASACASFVSGVINDVNCREEEVALYPLDDILPVEDMQKVGLIKIDVEGYEYKVMLGAEKLLSNFNPPILFECEFRHSASLAKVFSLLFSYGYNKGSFLTKNGIRQIEEFTEDMQSNPKSSDYINNFLFTKE